MFYYLTSSGAREGDNVVFVREPGYIFDPSSMKVGQVCMHFLSLKGQGHIYYKSIRDSAV